MRGNTAEEVECAAQRFQDTRCFVIRGRGTGAIAYRLLLDVLVQPVTSRCRQRRASVSRRRSTLGAASVGEIKPCCSPRNRLISRRTRPSGRWVTAASREECGVVVTCSQIGVWTSVCEWSVRMCCVTGQQLLGVQSATLCDGVSRPAAVSKEMRG